MKQLKQILIIGGSAVVLAACTGNLDYDKVAKLPSKGSMFQSYLHKEYVKLAESEYLEADLGDTAYFTGRARMAADAKAFGPQNMAKRALPKNKVGELSSARAKLVGRLRLAAQNDCQRCPHGRRPCSIAGCKSRKRISSPRILPVAGPVSKPP